MLNISTNPETHKSATARLNIKKFPVPLTVYKV